MPRCKFSHGSPSSLPGPSITRRARVQHLDHEFGVVRRPVIWRLVSHPLRQRNLQLDFVASDAARCAVAARGGRH